MIKLKNVTKSFYGKTVIENTTLELPEGKFITLLGENGSGKSTLLNLMSGYELPTQGDVTYKGHSLSELDFPFIYDITVVHEKIDYLVHLSVEEFIQLQSQNIPRWDNHLFQEMVNARRIDLKQNFQTLSRGQKMQVTLMINLASRPPIMLLDEITSVIDVHGRKYFLELLHQYAYQGGTVVITTNIVNELEFYTDHLVIIKNNGVALNQNVQEIPNMFYKIRILKDQAHPVIDDPQCVWAGVNSDHSISYIVPSSLKEKYGLDDSFNDRRKSTLEDIFIYYFNKEKLHEDAA